MSGGSKTRKKVINGKMAYKGISENGSGKLICPLDLLK